MDNSWHWRIGFLHGYGDAAWQELAGQIRRITKIIPMQQGAMMTKAIPCVASAEQEPQFDGAKMIVDSIEPNAALVQDLSRHWSPIQIA